MWPPAALDFLRELEDNNDRDWFRANRHRYDADLLAPARALAEQLADLGSARFFRPYRDTRFRPGPPLKEHIAFGLGDGRPGGYYVELSLDGLLVGGGLHHPDGGQLGRFRAAVDDDRRVRQLERAIATLEDAGLRLIDPELKRAPKGFSPDHPHIDRLRLKRITAFRRHELGPWLHTPECDARVGAELRAIIPLMDWIQAAVGSAG